MKKVVCLFLTLLLIISSTVVSFAQTEDIVSKSVHNKICFDISGLEWERFDKVYCHIYSENGDVFLAWQSKGERCINTNNDSVFTYDLTQHNIELKDDITYYVIFSNIFGEQSTPLEFTTENIGQTAYFTGQYGAENSYDLYFPVFEWSDTTAPYDFAKGDVDCDDEITIFDATVIQNFAAGNNDLEHNVRCVADVDNDGDVSILDATVIQRYLAKLDKIPDDVMLADEFIDIYRSGSYTCVMDDKSYEYTMPILNIDTPYADEINNRYIEEVYTTALERMELFENELMGYSGLSVDYKVYLNGNVLSLVVETHSAFLDNYYCVNADIYSGKEIKDEELLNSLSLNFDDIKDEIKTTIEDYYVENYGADFTYSEENKSSFEQTMLVDDIKNFRFFLSEDNKLCIIFTVYYAIQTGYNVAVAEIIL